MWFITHSIYQFTYLSNADRDNIPFLQCKIIWRYQAGPCHQETSVGKVTLPVKISRKLRKRTFHPAYDGFIAIQLAIIPVYAHFYGCIGWYWLLRFIQTWPERCTAFEYFGLRQIQRIFAFDTTRTPYRSQLCSPLYCLLN